MKKSNRLFFFIGIGFGLMLASLFGIINNKFFEEEIKTQIVVQKEYVTQPLEEEVVGKYIVINVEKGQSTDEIAQQLLENRIIYDKDKFIYILDLLDIYGKIPEGQKKITKGKPILETINQLLK